MVSMLVCVDIVVYADVAFVTVAGSFVVVWCGNVDGVGAGGCVGVVCDACVVAVVCVGYHVSVGVLMCCCSCRCCYYYRGCWL